MAARGGVFMNKEWGISANGLEGFVLGGEGDTKCSRISGDGYTTITLKNTH